MKLKNKVAYYIIAVSGGPDSMCLLNKYKHRDICVCHVNYLKRESSNRDEEIVRNYCLKNNIKLEVLRVSEEMYRDYKKMYGNNFECVARNIRYDFFITNLKKYNAKYILVGHNYNDHLETAYSMMEKKSKALYYGIMQVSGRKDTIILRPIMNMYKADTEKYCKKHNVPYGIDETNFDPKYTRNRIRQMMSNWTKKELKKFKSKIKFYNFRKILLRKAVNKCANKWIKTNYSQAFFQSKIKPKLLEHICYWILSECQAHIAITHDKILLLIDFIKNNTNSTKMLRIGEGVFVRILNKCVNYYYDHESK